MVIWTVYKGFFINLDQEKSIIDVYESILCELKRYLMLNFSKFNEENKNVLRTISKYKIDHDFKGTRWMWVFVFDFVLNMYFFDTR